MSMSCMLISLLGTMIVWQKVNTEAIKNEEETEIFLKDTFIQYMSNLENI